MQEEKHIVPRALIGFLAGVGLSLVVILSISLAVGTGQVFLVTPELETLCGSELAAFALQTGLCGLIGVAFAEASLAFFVEPWSFLRQYLVFCAVSAAVWVPSALLCWFPRTGMGGVSLLISFGSTYLINWLIQYRISRRNVQKLNAHLRRMEKEMEP